MEEAMRLPAQPHWCLLPRPDLRVERSTEPRILKLDAAVDWIKKNKPLLWVGSIFSVPEPSGFPSGYALTRSLFDLIFPADGRLPENARDQMIDALMPRWPLEALFDEFEFLDFDLSESLLAFFAALNDRASPNALHDAITRYYERGLAGAPLCVTTNWDTLIEKAFRVLGYKVHVAGPAAMPPDGFGKLQCAEKIISVYHPHGSFETRDVVCSSLQEQQQLMLHMGFKYHPILFLGYSGYEPSLYRHLEYSGPQLWCIRDERDLELPAKRRLLCRRGTEVFVGDMLELLRELQLLDRPVSLSTNYVALEGQIPPKVIEVIHCSVAARLEPQIASDFLADALCSDYPEPELSFRLHRIISAIDNHVRNRMASSQLPLSLMAGARFRDGEALWVSLLAYLLRHEQSLRHETIERILGHAATARKGNKSGDDPGSGELLSKLIQARTRCYRSFLGRPERGDDDARNLVLNQMSWIALGDMALGAELTELAAFAALRADDEDQARGFFDTAATFYYLTDLWNAGRYDEWACNNTAAIKECARSRSLIIPVS
jgi:SIR2-like domain